ncbi:unnamed protein product [Ixodes persulcatus]
MNNPPVQLSLTADNSGGSVAFTRENTLKTASMKPNPSSNPRGLGKPVAVQRKRNLKMLIGLLWATESLKTPFTASRDRVHLHKVSSDQRAAALSIWTVCYAPFRVESDRSQYQDPTKPLWQCP